MAYFRILIEGTGFELSGSDGEPPVRGFFVSRTVRASSASEAEHLALARVSNEWRSGKLSSHKVSPALTISETYPTTFFSSVFSRQHGYVFHPG